MYRIGLDFAFKHVSGCSDPMTTSHEWYVLLSLQASGDAINVDTLLSAILEKALEAGDIHDAVIEAAVTRCRPIVLTSRTTFAGLSPLLLNQSVQAQILVPMATSVAWGVVFATVVTLLVVPVGYLILDDLGRKLSRGRTSVSPSSADAGASAGR